ncbi:MAG: cell division protein FtsZ [Campylobacterota bacterium]
MSDFNVEIQDGVMGAKIKAIGVGGGGGNMINHMINDGVGGIDLIVANTDAQALSSSLAPMKIQLGEKLTRGLGAGMKPDIGKESAEETYEELKTMLEGADIVFVSSGLGGGTGTGAAPIIAKAAKEVGALTVSVVTKPFKFEGKKRGKLAQNGLDELKKESDSLIVIPNDKLLAIVEKNMGLKESFKMVDDILSRAVGGVSDMILSHGASDINVDFADIKTVMSHKGMALMGIGHFQGNNAAYEAVKDATESPLLDNVSINGAMGILVNIYMHPDYPILEVSEAMTMIEDLADEDVEFIWGTTTDDSVPIDEIKVTIVATGFEKEEPKSVNKVEVSQEAKQEAIREKKLQQRRVVGGYDMSENEDYLDIPPFMRNQRD